MTKLLQEAFNKASQLPEELQDELAQEVLDELLWEVKWDETLERSSDVLDSMAQKALDDFDHGKTEEKGMDEL
jgi:hypothetical protein